MNLPQIRVWQSNKFLIFDPRPVTSRFGNPVGFVGLRKSLVDARKSNMAYYWGCPKRVDRTLRNDRMLYKRVTQHFKGIVQFLFQERRTKNGSALVLRQVLVQPIEENAMVVREFENERFAFP